ncbi:MAG: hypothetical protein AAF328_10145 [Planctomycetota bacterium]
MPQPRTFPRVVTTLTAVVAVLASTTSHAAIVQITQSGNRATLFVDNLDADLTGDGLPDVTITGVFANTIVPSPLAFGVGATINGIDFVAAGRTFLDVNLVEADGTDGVVALAGETAESSYYFPIVFSDADYGLTGEDGWVEVYVRANDTEPEDSGVEIRRLVFDPDQRGTPGFDENLSYPEAVVPEPTVGLTFTALATCALRRRRRAI